MKGLTFVVKGLKADTYAESCEVILLAPFVTGYQAHLTGFNILMPGLMQTNWDCSTFLKKMLSKVQ
ncbi:hypothetical protein [Bacillus sp. LL01]|uniref:hypothetical protein n=1 Tax=Bacillus sp. LL01 TaxID=1665556 RepID=UPI000FFF3ACC|nr:hypothetical protein [Bacillus sp. LL01]